MPTDVQNLTCEACQCDLAAYIDLERIKGSTAAAHQFPHVWWHLWICPTCVATYHFTLILLNTDDAQLDLPRLQQLAVQPPMFQITTPAAILACVVAAHRSLGVAWGADEEEIVLAEEDIAGQLLTLSAQALNDDSWRLTLATAPPLAGRAILTIGDQRIHAMLNASGDAVFAPLPAAMLAPAEGSPLSVVVESTGLK